MTQKAHGTISGHRVAFTAAHRAFSDTPAEVQVTMSFPMSYEDITATLYIAVKGGVPLSELDDDDYVRRLVLDFMLNDSADSIEGTLLNIGDAQRGTAEYALIQAIRARVAEVFAPVSRPTQSRRRTLAGVSR